MRPPLVVFGLALLVYCTMLGSTALWDNDETTYAQIAREMMQSGDWITLHFKGRPWFCHPPLYYWLIAALSTVCGVLNEWTARLPAAFFGAACVTITWLLANRMGSRTSAHIAAAAMGLNFQFYMESRMALLDTALMTFCTLSLLGWWMGYQGERRGYYILFVSMGLACLAKGPFGLVFPWMIVLPFLVARRELGRLKEIPWLIGIPLAAIIGLSWYLAEALLHGQAFTDPVLVYFTYKRFTLKVQNQGGPIWLYFAILGAGFFPWSLMLPPALAQAWRRCREPDFLFLLLWVVVPFIFFTAAATKLPNYILFVYPAAAILVGRWCEDAPRGAWRVPVGLAIVVAGLFIAGMAWTESGSPYAGAPYRAAYAALGLFVVGAAWAWNDGWKPLAVGCAAFLMVCSTVLSPMAEVYRPVKPLALRARDFPPEARLIICEIKGEFGCVFYANRPVKAMQWPRDEGELTAAFKSSGQVVALMPQTLFEEMKKRGDVAIHLVAVEGKAVLASNTVVPSTVTPP